ncbi:5103_t:CDS:2 [Entrophospora sp. SA101]|nr:5103_t:CDS:2 [Entrophospora sp. SA101]
MSTSRTPAEYALVGDSGVRPSLSIKVRPGFYDAIEQYEKTSEDVNSFWLSIDMKKQLDIKKLQCAGNALDAVANETHLRSVVMSEIISIMKQPLERSDDIYHNKIGNNVIIPREIKLPLASVNSSSKAPKNIMGVDIIEAFHKYQNTIPKTRRVFIPAYWGVLDLTGESLYDCKQFTEKDIMQQSQGFADNIYWKTMPPEKNIQQYFDSNCEKKADDIRKLDGMMTEEELKMSSTFPLFRGVFTSDKIKSTWGEVQALSTNYACNETGNPFKRARIGR